MFYILGVVSRHAQGFINEYDIQRALMFHWSKTPFSDKFNIVTDEFPVDQGPNSRRIDILAKNPLTGDWLVIEVKRAEAKVDAIDQIEDYISALRHHEDFLHGKIYGALVSERIPDDVITIAHRSGI